MQWAKFDIYNMVGIRLRPCAFQFLYKGTLLLSSTLNEWNNIPISNMEVEM